MKLLRKLFIKDYLNVDDPIVREKHGLLASIGGIITNLLLFVFKIVVGIFSFSFSIISDAINNLTDLFSCIVNLLGFKLSAMPADKKHPYGHERIEYIAGMIISLVIISVSIVLGYTAVCKLIDHDAATSYGIATFIVLGAAILLKVFLGLFYFGLGKAISSEPLKASMIDSFNDAICTTAVLIATIVNYFYPDIWWLDGTLSLLVAVFILYSGIKSVVETASPLIGSKPDHRFIEKIIGEIQKFEVVLGVHDVICHSYGHTKKYITAHCEVDGNQNFMKVHDEIDIIEHYISDKFNVILTIHMDPIDTRDKEFERKKEELRQIVKDIHPLLDIHDLRIVEDKVDPIIMFDVLKADDVSLSDEDLKSKIIEKVKILYPNYQIIIEIDFDY